MIIFVFMTIQTIVWYNNQYKALWIQTKVNNNNKKSNQSKINYHNKVWWIQIKFKNKKNNKNPNNNLNKAK